MVTYHFDHWDINGVTYTANPQLINVVDNLIIQAIYSEGVLPKPCFIATAAYGSPLAKELVVLRNFRDGFMLQTSFGNCLVNAYYRLSPSFAKKLAVHQRLRWITRLLLKPIVSRLRKKRPFKRDPSEWEDMIE